MSHIECNRVVFRDGEEIAEAFIFVVNPAAVSYAEPCQWKNKSATNEGTLLHFINANTPPLKLSCSYDTWRLWVREAYR